MEPSEDRAYIGDSRLHKERQVALVMARKKYINVKSVRDIIEKLRMSIFTDWHEIINTPLFVHYGLLGLFLNSMLSSIIPIPTEVTLSALLLAGTSKTIVLAVLLASSITGGFISYYLGYSGNRILKRFYKMPEKQKEDRLNIIMSKYGWMAIFVSPWIPIYSDAIPIISGIKKFDLRKFTIAMVSGRIVKVVAVVYFLGWIIPMIFK